MEQDVLIQPTDKKPQTKEPEKEQKKEQEHSQAPEPEKKKPKESGDFNLARFFNGILKINHHFFNNYVENFSGYQHDNRDIVLTYSSLFASIVSNPSEMIKIQRFFLDSMNEQQVLWNSIFMDQAFPVTEDKTPSNVSLNQDQSFHSIFLQDNKIIEFLNKSHSLQKKLSKRIVNEVDLGSTKRKKLDFYSKQYMELFSPSNYLISNPEAIDLAIKTNGKSLWNGFNNFVRDIEKGRISQVDESAFEVGVNLANSPGAVVFENELMQLIQYKPSTKTVQEVPILMIPPWINKYYILDLRPEKSFVKYMVDGGFTVFMISWRNPSPGMGYLSFDDYVDIGAIKAIEVVKEISSADKVNTLGYCLGGTLLGVTAAILRKRKINVINTITFLASMLEFSDIGPMGDVINEALVHKLERGELMKDGVMHGHDMERAFNLIRVKDLVWKYVIDNYLKGEAPQAFDIMYWTNDNTNLPSRMYIYYMREMIFNNKLAQKDALTISETEVDLGKIDMPIYLVALKKDYISPAKTVFITSNLVNGPVEFILGESGHVMGIVNPPSRNKYGYYTDGILDKGFEEWEKTAKFHEGSWWTAWREKIKEKSGRQIPAPKMLGNENYKEIEPAPGEYVKYRCEHCFPNSNADL